MEYLGEHYYSDHKFSTEETHIRSLAIANVYLINGLWIITPMFSPLWAWLSIQNAFSDDETAVRKTS